MLLNEKKGNIIPPFVYPYAFLIRIGLHIVPRLCSIPVSLQDEPVARVSFHNKNKLYRGGDADRTGDAKDEERRKISRKYHKKNEQGKMRTSFIFKGMITVEINYTNRSISIDSNIWRRRKSVSE